MNVGNIKVDVKNSPVLEPEFVPMGAYMDAYEKNATEPIAIAVYRESGNVSVYDTKIYGTEEMFEDDLRYVERIVKFMLWAAGGFKVVICGSAKIYEALKELYRFGGRQNFDVKTMSDVYESEFVIENVAYDAKPEAKSTPKSVGGHVDGCRIGFDAGGSDMKVSAVVDGEVIYSEEIIWLPKVNTNPDYHLENIVMAMNRAKEKMPRVDAIGISSAGIYVNNRTMLASLFLAVGPEDFEKKVKDIYINACAQVGENIPFEVANDGDVSALAGAMDLKDNKVMGLAMGTSEAVGYVDASGNITGMLNELAFAPVDMNPEAPVNSWSGDIGVGSDYLSQDAVIRLAPRAGITLDETLTPAQKLKVVQGLANEGDKAALSIFESIGAYLGHSIATYSHFYDIKYLLLLGRVSSGKGGDLLVETCRKTLEVAYPELKVSVELPDEMARRVGQSIAAASLVKLG
ncbi:MAG: ROK family protein [Ruminococcaceae bacterium]|nr:ROK family protein [Oscillospiraceae bacterium]